MDKPLQNNIVSRRVNEIKDGNNNSSHKHAELALEDFRDTGAWVLLGEPGAGKSTSLQQEAGLSGGVFLTIANFISEDINPEWNGKTLFLDGLDEIRASSKGSEIPIIRRIGSRLKKLGRPSFRLSCRAADWYGSSDGEVLKTASPSKQITILQLEPLNKNEIKTLLQNKFCVPDPDSFFEKAEDLGIDELLNNPQTLELIIKAITGNKWPTNRNEAYQLACEKMVTESNREHRNLTRNSSKPTYTTSQLLDAAGQLCAVLLLSDQAGLALDAERENSYFLSIEQCGPPNFDIAKQATASKLFKLISEERISPCHRSVSEYLASKWLAQQIDQQHLPLTRLLNLLLGTDNGVVAGLRGLYGWLTLHSLTARKQLIQSDSLAVILYGDPTPMPVEDKRQILWQLRHDADNFPNFRGDFYNSHFFGRLASSELEDDLISILQSKDRSDAHQSHLFCVLDILGNSEPSLYLISYIYNLIIDNSYWSGVRTTALRIWLDLEIHTQSKITLLNNIHDNVVRDDEDELIGQLLSHLYPSQLEPKELLKHLHNPKRTNVIGSYYRFWDYELIDSSPDSYLPELMDELYLHPILESKDSRYEKPTKCFIKLLNRCIRLFGDSTEDQRLLNWLKIRAQDNMGSYNETIEENELLKWFKTHPERYKALLKLCYEDTAGIKSFDNDKTRRLSKIPLPADIGLWHFHQAQSSLDTESAKLHFQKAVSLLIYQPEIAIGLTLEILTDWADTKTEVMQWLEPWLVNPYPDWHTEDATSKKEHKRKKAKEKLSHTKNMMSQLDEISSGTAIPHTMYTLAGIREKRFSNVYGDNAEQRFDDFFNHGKQIYAAAENGFKHCLERDDIPAVEEILKLYLNNKQSYLQTPCLIGLSLLYAENAASLTALPVQTLQSMIAFYLTGYDQKQHQWIDFLAERLPELVAEVLTVYLKTLLKANHSHLNGLYELGTREAFEDVARIVTPQILKIFPLRGSADTLYPLKRLLGIGIRFTPLELVPLIEEKLSKKSMGVNQKIYWHATALIINNETYQDPLWAYIKTGNSHKKINALAEFFSNDFNEIDIHQTIPISTLGKLIEALAPTANMSYDSKDSSVTLPQRRGDNIRKFIKQLELSNTTEAINEIDRLLTLETTQKVHYQLGNTRHELLNRQREERFTFLSAKEVADIINNKALANAADLLALTNATLTDIANNIKYENDDGYQSFWNTKTKEGRTHKSEEECRNEIIKHLKYRLETYGIDCQREASHRSSNRSDIRLSYKSEFELPIEIKGEWHKDIWTAIKDQLIPKYTIAPKAEGHGIYLVLWFGENPITMSGGDGGKRPLSAQELQKRLTATISSDYQKIISVHVIDVSWPKKI